MAERKSSSAWRVFAIIGMIAIFGFRMYRSYQRENDRKKDQDFFEELSKRQMKQQRERDAERLKTYNDSIAMESVNSLDASKAKLDSIRINLEANQAKFDSSMKANTPME